MGNRDGIRITKMDTFMCTRENGEAITNTKLNSIKNQVSNFTSTDYAAYFDDLHVEHIRGPLTEGLSEAFSQIPEKNNYKIFPIGVRLNQPKCIGGNKQCGCKYTNR